jgi:hypothetical protein
MEKEERSVSLRGISGQDHMLKLGELVTFLFEMHGDRL